ncbi:MAG: prepilin-type N-terminal cleavage/methylation domain-containing protein [Phycisphaeraceae bacterium]|nr:prepilin-type N-terminal cleavage/methylation domain-containing protein [Phycisphaeraceae bacterium]
MRSKPSSAFTLIELLVVISIIALLIAILLPALGAARRSAQSVQCASNQRQMGIATLAFESEHDGHIPIAGKIWQRTPAQITQMSYDGSGNPMTLPALLADYMGLGFDTSTTLKIEQQQQDLSIMAPFLCPRQEQVPDSALYLEFVAVSYKGPRSAISFGLNEAVFGQEAGTLRVAGNINRVRDSSKTMLFGDAQPRNQPPLTADWVTYPNASGSSGDKDTLKTRYDSGYTAFDLDRHDGSMNITFLDGHNESLQPESFDDVYLSKGIK